MRFEKIVPLSFKFQVFMSNINYDKDISTSTTNSENTIDINMEESSTNSNNTNIHNYGFTQSMPVSSNFLYSL